MQASMAYDSLVKQINATNSQKLDGYNENLLDELFSSEREKAEDLIWDTYYNKHETDILVLFPKLRKYDGINALKELVYNYHIPSPTNMLISYLIFKNTKETKYLEFMERNIIESQYDYSYVSMMIYSEPCEELYQVLKRIYLKCPDRLALSSSIDGILYNKGFIDKLDDVRQVSNMKELRNVLKKASLGEREKMIGKLENGEFDGYKLHT